MTPATYGVMGIMAGAAIVFFAYIGFDVVATTAEEAKNPQRDLPRGILGSLAICTVLYVAVTLVITGMQNYKDIDPKAALATAFTARRQGRLRHAHLGRRRGRPDHGGHDPHHRRHPRDVRDEPRPPASRRAWAGPTRKTGTPVRLTLIIGTVVALIASLTPIGKLEEMVNIGTLTAFMLVSLAVPILRKRRPDLKRSFKVPGNPVVPWLSAAACFYLVLNLSVETWIRFIVWMVLGFLIYFLYSRQHSKLATGEEESRHLPAPRRSSANADACARSRAAPSRAAAARVSTRGLSHDRPVGNCSTRPARCQLDVPSLSADGARCVTATRRAGTRPAASALRQCRPVPDAGRRRELGSRGGGERYGPRGP